MNAAEQKLGEGWSSHGTAPGHAPASSTGAGASLPRWQIERRRILRNACRRIQRRVTQGQSLRKALRAVSKRLNGRSYNSAPERRLHVCPKTLDRIFRRWRQVGDEAFTLHFGRNRGWLSRDQVAQFAGRCLAPGIRSMQMGFRELEGATRSVDAYRHALPEKVHSALVALFAARRKAKRLESEIQQIIA